MFQERGATALISLFGPASLVVVLVLAFIGILFLIICLVSWQIKGFGLGHGVIIGFFFGIWKSFCWICVPILGAYSNFLGAGIARIVFRDLDPWLEELCVHGVNLVLWPIFGALIFLQNTFRNEQG